MSLRTKLETYQENDIALREQLYAIITEKNVTPQDKKWQTLVNAVAEIGASGDGGGDVSGGILGDGGRLVVIDANTDWITPVAGTYYFWVIGGGGGGGGSYKNSAAGGLGGNGGGGGCVSYTRELEQGVPLTITIGPAGKNATLNGGTNPSTSVGKGGGETRITSAALDAPLTAGGGGGGGRGVCGEYNGAYGGNGGGGGLSGPGQPGVAGTSVSVKTDGGNGGGSGAGLGSTNTTVGAAPAGGNGRNSTGGNNNNTSQIDSNSGTSIPNGLISGMLANFAALTILPYGMGSMADAPAAANNTAPTFTRTSTSGAVLIVY